jgi:hypothetical protein
VKSTQGEFIRVVPLAEFLVIKLVIRRGIQDNFTPGVRQFSLDHVVLYCTFYNLYKLRCRHFNRRPEQLDLSAQKSAVPCMVFMHLRGFLAFQSIDTSKRLNSFGQLSRLRQCSFQSTGENLRNPQTRLSTQTGN